ncbi:MAG: hypothetical protein ACFE9D_09105 [Promethearchaeota archaeon]
MPVRSSWVKSTWLVVFLVLVLGGPFLVYSGPPLETMGVGLPSEVVPSPSQPISAEDSVRQGGGGVSVVAPAPSIPVFDGDGANLTATPYIEQQGSAYVTTGVWGDSPYVKVDTNNDTITSAQPSEGTIGHMACSIDNVYGYNEHIGLVPNGDFEVWPFSDIFPYGGDWDTQVAGSNDPFCEFLWIPPAVTPGVLVMQVQPNYLNVLPRTCVGEMSVTAHTNVYLNPGDYVRAFLHFEVDVLITVLPFTHTDDTHIRVYMDDDIVWSHSYGQRTVDPLEYPGGRTWDYSYYVYADVTDQIGSGGTYEIKLYLISDTVLSTPSFSFVQVMWQDVKLFVAEQVPAPPTDVYIEDLDTNERFYFDSQGFAELYTTATMWEFGPHPHYYFDANWTVSATLNELKNMTTRFSTTVDALDVIWDVTSPPAITTIEPGWVYSRYEAAIPLDWNYNQSEAGIGGHWKETFHILSSYTAGWHQFLEPNTAVDSINVMLQNYTMIIRSPCVHFMQGEQYAVNVSGIMGSYYLDVYNPIAYHESGNGWISEHDMWTNNNTGQVFSLSPNAPLGNYMVVVKCLGPTPLNQVGYSSAIFTVSEYHIASFQSEITSEGNVIVSGQLGSADSGDYTVYCVRAVLQSPAMDGRFDEVIGDMRLQDWYQTDCLISVTGEPIDIHFTVNNTGVHKENVAVTLRFLSLGSRSYLLFEKTALVSVWETNQLQEFNWPNLWIGPVGNNTMMRRGFYFMELEINGNRLGLHRGAIGSYLAVTDSPSMIGRVPNYRSIPVSYPDFTTEFVRFYGELAMPVTNYFLVTVTDVNHITADSVPVSSEILKLHTSLHQPYLVDHSYGNYTSIHPNGSLTAEAWMWSESPWLTDYNFSNHEYSLDYYVNWSTEFEYWGSAPINNWATPRDRDFHGISRLMITDSSGHPPGSYPLLIRYQGDTFTHACNITGTVEYAFTTISPPVSGPGTNAGFGGQGILMARLWGWTCVMDVTWTYPNLRPIPGKELIFAIFTGVNWQVVGVGVTDSDGWARIPYSASFVIGTHQVQVIFEGSGFLAGSLGVYNITIAPSVLFVGIIAPIIIVPVVISALVIRKIRKGRVEGGE